MDYIATADALTAIARSLEEIVTPTVTDTHARGQLWASIGLLNNLAVDVALVDGNEDAASTTTAADLRESIDGLRARQVSLHYRRAVTGD
ncbi:hypothetical protein [Microbacterium gorillae]|uniref:hypothetical protein n=1 Tax=Microbacterium gorillae TaxID=1231063 RepID=UPI00058F3B9F|nr:hypothetical protein [Microbacterium gorillae]